MWRFVGERHRIWYRKEQLKQPPPFTTDPVLQKFFFCNIYRKLDRGTIWYREHVVSVKQEFPDLLWRTIVYRLVNDVPTFQQLGSLVPGRVNWRDMIWVMRGKGIKPHSDAYPLALLRPPRLPTTLDRLEFILDQMDVGFDRMVYEIGEAKRLESVSALLQDQYGIGPFLALQIYRDLILARAIPFSDDDWVEVGPGARKALVGIFRIKGHPKDTELRELIRDLRKTETRWLKRIGLELPEPLTLGDLEHVLCEAGKFWRLEEGRGRKRYYGARV